MDDELPALMHKWSHSYSVLCVAPAPSRLLLFCGTQDGRILAYNTDDYSLRYSVACGDQVASVLCMTLSADESFLFTAGSDSLVRVWDLRVEAALAPICTHIIYSTVDIGDVFSVAWCERLSTLFVGAQNAAILWYRLDLRSGPENADVEPQNLAHKLPHFRYSRFFDSTGPGGALNRLQSQHRTLKKSTCSAAAGPNLLEGRPEDIVRFAHNGYVYCLEVVDTVSAHGFAGHLASYSTVLVSCGGDGAVNVWGILESENGVKIVKCQTLQNDELVLSMTLQDAHLYVGLSDANVNVWDMATYQLVRSFRFSPTDGLYDEVLSLGIHQGCVFRATSHGGLAKFALRAPEVALAMDTQPVLCVRIFGSHGRTLLATGGHRALCVWDVTRVAQALHGAQSLDAQGMPVTQAQTPQPADALLSNDDMLRALRQYIAFRTVLRLPLLYLEDLRHCAQFLCKLIERLGAAQTRLLPVANANPVVYAQFARNTPSSAQPAPRVLFYAHYDVVDTADGNEGWATDPFVLTAADGNLYARGVSDNKGPTLAALFAVLDLHRQRKLPCDVVFLIEGEEECGSIGFQDAVQAHRDVIGEVDWVLLSNSYWLDDETPCLNYGLRGVVNASVTVRSEKPDRHSGVDGGVSKEPTMDLIHILGLLVDPATNKIKLPGFYDGLLPLTETEIGLYRQIEAAAVGKNFGAHNVQSLMAKWRNPSLTVHKMRVSGPNNNTVIPQEATASISIRVVPNQELSSVKKLLIDFLTRQFEALNSDNSLVIDIFHEAEPWLGDPTNKLYKVLYEKIKSNWGLAAPEPLFIREGGSIPLIRFLEKCFGAPAAQIPCGQASDNAHLKNEKLRIANLYKLRSILADTLRELDGRVE